MKCNCSDDFSGDPSITFIASFVIITITVILFLLIFVIEIVKFIIIRLITFKVTTGTPKPVFSEQFLAIIFILLRNCVFGSDVDIFKILISTNDSVQQFIVTLGS